MRGLPAHPRSRQSARQHGRAPRTLRTGGRNGRRPGLQSAGPRARPGPAPAHRSEALRARRRGPADPAGHPERTRKTGSRPARHRPALRIRQRAQHRRPLAGHDPAGYRHQHHQLRGVRRHRHQRLRTGAYLPAGQQIRAQPARSGAVAATGDGAGGGSRSAAQASGFVDEGCMKREGRNVLVA